MAFILADEDIGDHCDDKPHSPRAHLNRQGGSTHFALRAYAACRSIAAESDLLAEENRIAELKAKCEKKGLRFEDEEAKYQAKLAEKKAKASKRNKN